MRRLKLYIVLTFALVNTLFVVAQDAAFSQFYSSELYLNPAMAGEEPDLTFSSNYRTQWSSIIVPYRTSQLSMIVPIYKNDVREHHLGGVGVSLYNDRAGEGNFKTLGVYGTFAYNLALTKDNSQDMAFGGQVGIIQKNIDFTNLQWGEQFNPLVGFDASYTPTESGFANSTFYPDFNFGAMYYYNPKKEYDAKRVSGFAGGAIYHLNRPNESFKKDSTSRLPMLYKVHAGVEYAVTPRVHIAPNAILFVQNLVNQVNAGMYFTYKMTQTKPGFKGYSSYKNKNVSLLENADVVVGVWHRVGDAFIFSLGLHTEAYTIGFSYDLNTSGLRFLTGGRGAYEFSLTLHRVKYHSMKRIATPRI